MPAYDLPCQADLNLVLALPTSKFQETSSGDLLEYELRGRSMFAVFARFGRSLHMIHQP